LAAAAANTQWPGSWPVAQGDEGVRGPGQRRHGAGPKLENLPITDVRELREWAQAEKIALTVVGPEAPLAAGVVDEFRAHGLRIFGPTKAAAQLESSKAFSKAFMRATAFPRPTTTPSPTRLRPTPSSTAWARPSSSRPMAWRPARAWWWP
jgi:hypothetical protein